MQLICLVAIAASIDVSSVVNPRAADGWVSDGADMIGASDEARLDELGDELEKQVGLELAVVTVDAVGGPVRPFAVELFNHWGIGDADVDNGLLFFVARKERALEGVVGDGMRDVISDEWLKRMQDQVMIPHFKSGNPGAGLVAGVEAVQRYLRSDAAGEGEAYAPPTPTPVQAATAVREDPGHRPASVPAPVASVDDDGEVPWGYAGGGVGVLALGGLGLWWRRKRWRTCQLCKRPNFLLDEVSDDKFLDAGQRREEQIGSVDYDVFHCPPCDRAQIRSRGRWFSGYRRCPECRYKARTVKSTTISAATYSSSGSMRVDEDCQSCSFTRTSYRTIPMKVASNDDSSFGSGSSGSSFGGSSGGGSSGGGSYGGGSSSGGGASSSW